MAIEAELPDGRVLEFPDGTNPAVIQATVKRVLGLAPTKSTIAGQAKELVKGLVPGAVGLVEQAAIGASALLPEAYEKPTREAIARVAGAAKAPFAAAPGYEESVGRKLSEAIGSTAPFLLAGPFGLAGRAAAVGLGVGAGAGEARTRAEKEGATEEQRGTATALGVIPGAMEAFAPFRILSRVPEAATAQGVQLVKRALLAGGEEAAQEAASGFAQNLIAKGVYKPEQELIEGLGEQAAYGGATGAIVQGLMDLALGRRARGAAAPPPGAPAEAPIERTAREAQAAAPAAAPAPEVPPVEPAVEPAPVAPPAAEAPPPAETVSEPEVVKKGEPPPTGLQPEDLTTLGLKKKQPLYKRLLGKDMDDPAQRDAALADIENYLVKGHGSEESRASLTAFKERFAPAAEPAPTETPSVPTAAPVEQPSGASPAVAGEPVAGAAPGGAGITEPTGVVPTVADVTEPAGREGQQPAAVTPFVSSVGVVSPVRSQYLGEAANVGPEQQGVVNAVRQFRERIETLEEARDRLEDQQEAEEAKQIEAELRTLAKEKYGRQIAALWPKIQAAKKLLASTKYEGSLEAKALQRLVDSLQSNYIDRYNRSQDPAAEGFNFKTLDEQISEYLPQDLALFDNYTAKLTKAAPTKTTEAPEYTEKDIEDALAANLITPEQAERAREELRTEEAPPTTTTAALQKQIDDIKAQMDALRQKNGKPPAKKSPARAKFDALQEQLYALQPAEEGDLEDRLKTMGASGVVGSRGTRPTIDLDAVRENLTKARATPKMYEAMLNYIGVDKDGNYLPTTYSSDEAAELVGFKRSSGANVRRAAEAMGITTDVISRFHAGQTDKVGIAKNVSESGTGAPVENVKPGLLYTPPTKKKPAKVVGFLRPALTEDDKLDFSTLTNRQVAEMYARASNFDPKRENNIEVINQLNGEIDARTKKDKKGMQQALDSAYRVVRIEEEETAAEETEASELPKETGAEDTTRRLSDETPGLTGRPTPGVASPGITRAVNRGDTRRALQAIRETPEATPLDHQIAQRFLGLGQFLGFPKIETRPKDQIKGSGQYNASSDTASIAAGEEDTHTVLHEVTHAFVHKLIVANEKGLRNDAGYRDLKQLYDYLKKTYPALEKEYGMSSVTEFASEAMSNPQFQKKLGTIRYKTRAAWSQFVQAVRKLLKIGAGDSSALVEAIAGVDSLLRVGREYQKTGPDIGAGTVSVITPEAEATAEELDVIGEKKPDRFRDKVGRELRGNVALRLREKFVSSMAPMEDWFTKAYGGQIRTASGRLNPIVQLSRALDSGRVSKAAQVEGGLAHKEGLIVASELKNAKGESVSYLKVLKRIADTAKAEGKTYENYRNTIDNILYGHREYGLREKNNQIEQQAQALEAAGKKDEAKALRENKVKLLLNDGQIDRAEAAFQRDKFIKGVLADLDTIRFNMLDMLVDTGRITAEQAQDYKDAIGYIPFNRIGEYEEAWTNATRGANRGAAALKRMRAFEGSDRKSTSVIENFSGLMDWGTREAMKNEAARRALEDMELMGAAQRRDNKPASDSPGAIVTVYRDGTPTKYYVPDPAHIATFSMADPQLSNFWKGLSQATRVLRAGVTSMPPFAVKQVFDDIVRAYTYAGVKNNGELVKNVLFNFPGHWVNEVFKRKTDSVRELERLGVVGTFDFTQHTNLKDILRESGAEKEGLGHNILRVMEAGAKASDLAVREAIYRQVLKETKSEQFPEGDTAKAESAAREIINFSRRGSSNAMNIAISIIPFFNAYAQGMDKLATAAAGKVVGQTTGTARSMFYKRMGVLTAMGLAYALMMQDDDEYQALPDHVRDTNWIIPGAKINGQLVGIPVPAELAFFFKAIPERVLRYYKYQGTEEEQAAIEVLGNLVKRGIDVFSTPNLMAQGVRPLVENMVNYSFFLGRPLESQAQLRLRPAERYGTGTSEAMKTVAQYLEDAANATGVEAFAISPIKLENALRGIFGTSAGIALSLADMAINPDRTDRPLHQQLSSQLTGASAVLKSAVGTRYMDEIYNLEERTTQVYNSYNRLLETAPEKADKFLEDNIGMYSIRDAVQGVMESIRSLNDTAKLIDRDTSMSPEERRKAIDELRAEQNDIARQVYILRKQAMNIQLGL